MHILPKETRDGMDLPLVGPHAVFILPLYHFFDAAPADFFKEDSGPSQKVFIGSVGQDF